MPIQPDDLFLINTTDGLKKITYNELFSGLDGGPPVTISEDAPADPSAGDLWWANDDDVEGGGRLYLWTGDEWVDVSIPFGGGDSGSIGCLQAPVTIVSDSGHYVGTELTALGGNGRDGDTPLYATYAWSGPKTGTGNRIVADVAGVYTVTATISCSSGGALTTTDAYAVEELPAGVINFSPVINDDGTPEANTPDHVLTAVAENITGGESPVEYEYEWKVDNLTMGSNKTLNIVKTFVGKIVTCDITVAEPDGSNPITKTAVYSKVIAESGTINTPSVLSPADGAGSGDARYLKSDTIIDVEGGGIATCETELISNVDADVTATYRFITDNNVDYREYWSSAGNEIEATYGQPPTGTSVGSAFQTLIFTDTKTSPSFTHTGGGLIRLNIYKSDDGNFWTPDVSGQINNGNRLQAEGTAQYWKMIRDDNAAMAPLNWYLDAEPITVLTFPSAQGFDCFEVGEVVQGGFNGLLEKIRIKLIGTPDGGARNIRVTENGVTRYLSSSEVTVTTTGTITGIDNVVDGNDSTLATFKTSNAEWIATLNTPIAVENVSILLYRGNNPGELGKMAFAFNDEAYTNHEVNFDNSYSWTDEDYAVKIISKDAEAVPPTITVDGGDWTGSDGSGTPGEQTTLVKETPYDSKLTVASDKDLADMTGGTIMTDGSTNPTGAYTQTPYKLVTTNIESVDNSDPDNIVLTFPGDVSQNPDLRYFLPGDTVQQTSGTLQEAKLPTNVTLGSDGETVTHTGGSVTWNTGFGPLIPATGKFYYEITCNNYGIGTEAPSGVPALGFHIIPNDRPVSDTHTSTSGLSGLIVPTSNVGPNVYPVGSSAAQGRGPATAGLPGTVMRCCIDTDARKVWFSDSVNGPNNWWRESQTTPGPVPDGSNDDPVNGINASASGGKTPVFSTGNISAGFICQFEGLSNTGYSFTVHYDKDGWAYEPPAGFEPLLEGEPVKVVSTDLASNSMVVDGGEWLGSDGSGTADADTVVEYKTNGGEGNIVSVNTDDNTILLTDTGTRDNRWIAENKAATDFYVAGPSIVDEPLLTADVELKSTDFATTPENVDTLKNIVWELNNVEQNAGVSNPYKPTLNTNTTYTVRVKHQGNALDDSEWSAVTTFTTGATRNLYTYYKERVELLESRLASIEADEVNDDATDTALLTLLANLATRVTNLEENN